MGLLIWQECDSSTYQELKNRESYALGELKTIRFFLNKRDDRNISEEEEKLLTAWHNGERINEDIII